MGACEHLLEVGTDSSADPIPDAEPGALCPDCRKQGTDVWAHLRMCLECGHVGCCDSSPHRHASVHHEATGHPVMRSFEPGEKWRWCYLDRRLAV